MRANWFNFLLVMSIACMLAPPLSADPPEREGRGGPPPRDQRDGVGGDRPRSERDRDERDRFDSGRPDGQRGPGGPGGPGPMDPGRMMRMLPIFATLDANTDGTISTDEINNATAALKKLDKNNDGKLDMMELRPDFAGRPGPPRDGDRGPRPGEPRDGERGPREDGPRDSDRGPRDRGPRDGGPRDGERGPRETAGSGDNPMLQRLMQLDSDGNGELSADELTKLPERGERLMQFADRDKDGTLSKEELQSMKARGEEMRRGRGDRGRD